MLFKFLVSVVFVACQVSAFMAPRVQSRSSKISMAVTDLAGISAPFGFFDPLGFSKCNEKTLAGYREAEIKHGRVAMMAVLGVLTQDRYHPLYDGANSGNPLAAISGVPAAGWVQIVVAIGVTEYCLIQASKQPGYVAGDYFGINARIDTDDDRWMSIQTRELNNGRLAMFAIMGELTHAVISGKGPFEQLNSVGMIP